MTCGPAKFSHFNVCFADLAIGEIFSCNGNVWRKRSSRTATSMGVNMPPWAYFRANDMCKPAVGPTP